MDVRNKFLILLAAVAALSMTYYLASTDRSKELVLVGTVDANQVVVSAQVQGRIQKLAVEEGARVKAGDLLAVLDPSELEAERDAAAATLASLKDKLAETRFTERSTEGSTTGDVANARARLESGRAQLQQAEATLVRVESDTRRTVELARQNIASDQDRVQAEANLKAQLATIESLRMQVGAAQADLDSALARTNQATAARSTVASTRDQMASARAQMEGAEVRLGYTRITAPVSGAISVRAAREGEVVAPGSPIVTIIELGDTWVRAPIPETYADRVAMDEVVALRLPGGTLRQGKVFFKAVESDFATQRDVSRRKRDIKTLILKIRLDNPEGAYVPGMTAEVLLTPQQISGGAPAAPGRP